MHVAPAAPSPEGGAFAHTALQCLVAVARRHGVDLSVAALAHENALRDQEPDDKLLVAIAEGAGFRAKVTSLNWERLSRLGDAYPIIARLQNGNSVVLLGLRGDGEDAEIGVLDPLADKPTPIFLDRERFTKAWAGQVLMLRRRLSLDDENRPFGLAWFLPEILRQRKVFIDITLAAICLHLLALLTPVFFQIVIDKVLVHEATSTLNVVGAGMAIALVFDTLLTWLRGLLLLHATNKIDMRLASRTFSRLLSLPATFFEHVTAGVLTKHMQQTQKIREFLTGRLFMTLLDSLALFVFLPLLLYYSIGLTMVVLACSAVIAGAIALLIGPFNVRLRALYAAEAERQSMLVEAIHGMKTIKSLALEPVQRRNWEERMAVTTMRHFSVGKISVSARALMGFVEKLMMLALPWVGAAMVFDGAVTVGTLVAFQMLAGRVSGPLVQLVSLVHEYQETALSVRMLGEIMNQTPEGAGRGRGLRPSLKGHLSFEKVRFHYDPNGRPALDDLSLDIPAGSFVGLVGRSGSGKTTLTRLMQGLYSFQQGSIKIDGYDLREIDLAHLRTSMGVVLQENFLFRGSVRENIAIARPDSSFERIVQAARMAGADEFVQQLPLGYDTVLEENAANLSGGQRQRLAIARALLANPPILILDEATSALDPESEAIVHQSLESIRQGRTLVVVSHRLSTLVTADRIAVMDKGALVACAPHAELLQSCPLYRDLWLTQNRHLS